MTQGEKLFRLMQLGATSEVEEMLEQLIPPLLQAPFETRFVFDGGEWWYCHFSRCGKEVIVGYPLSQWLYVPHRKFTKTQVPQRISRIFGEA